MQILTIDGRTFKVKEAYASTPMAINDEYGFIDWIFEEDGKRHMARMKTKKTEEGHYKVLDDEPAEWFVEE